MMRKNEPERSSRTGIAAAALTFALVAPLIYSGLRLREVLTSEVRVNPIVILRDMHTAFYWRAAIATWGASVVAMLVYAISRNGSGSISLGSRTENVFKALAVVVALGVAALSLWFP